MAVRTQPPVVLRSWYRTRTMIVRGAIYLFLSVCAVVFFYPFYNMVIGSFMDDNELFSRVPTFWPKSFDLEAYGLILDSSKYQFLRALANSYVIAFGATVGTLFFCTLAGYVYAKRRFPGRDLLFMIMLGTMLLPDQGTIVPWYLLMTKVLNWGNTFLPFWIPGWATAFGIFWMRQYIAAAIPDELLDAAAIDGCSPWGSFIRIVIPLVVPGMIVLGILVMIGSLKGYLGPLLLLTNPEMYTAPQVLANFKGSMVTVPRYSVIFAGSVLFTLPVMVLFFVFQRRLMEGIMSGAIKGA